MTCNKHYLTISLCAALSACATNSVPDSHTLQFDTRIVNSSLKQFKIHMQPKYISTGIDTNTALKEKRQSGLTNFKNERNRDLKIQKILLTQLDKTLAENRYCQKGYWIINTHVHTNTPFLLGECNDTATEEDKRRFKNTIKRW